MSRSKARKEREALRTARRDSLLILLSRAQRGVLSRPEAAQLRVHVETELTLADQTRASAGGQQAAQQRTAHQLEAAHGAIAEAEQRAKDAEEQLRAYRAVFGHDALDTFRAITAERNAMRADMAAAAGHPEHVVTNLYAQLSMWKRRAAEVEQPGTRYRAAWMSARRRAREHAAEEQRVRGWAGHWNQHYREAREQLGRTRAAWRSARRRAQERTRDAYANAAEYRQARADLEQHLAAAADEPIGYALAEPAPATP